MLTYEQQLDRDFDWALLEGSKYFECRSAVHRSMRQLVSRIEELGVEYAVTGDLCMFFHGYRRFTQFVEVLTSRPGLAEIQRLIGDGYHPDVANPNFLRDSETGVRIKFLVAGQPLSDETHVPIIVPRPQDTLKTIDGVKFVDVGPLIEMKLVRGRASYRLRDLADVQDMVHCLGLPREFSTKLNPFVRDSFDRIWNDAQTATFDEY